MTENNGMNAAGVEALAHVLERYGSDRTRWPAPVRRQFAGLLSESGDAQRRLREAEALDRLLDLAPPPVMNTRALADRIVAAAEAEMPRAPVKPAHARWSVFGRRPAAESQWPAAALLAASLVLGTVFGLSGTFGPTGAQLAAVDTETEPDTDFDPGRLAFDNEAMNLFEEDFL